MGRHSTFLSREEHGVAAGALFYQAEGQKHCVMRKGLTIYRNEGFKLLCMYNTFIFTVPPMIASDYGLDWYYMNEVLAIAGKERVL